MYAHCLSVQCHLHTDHSQAFDKYQAEKCVTFTQNTGSKNRKQKKQKQKKTTHKIGRFPILENCLKGPGTSANDITQAGSQHIPLSKNFFIITEIA